MTPLLRWGSSPAPGCHQPTGWVAPWGALTEPLGFSLASGLPSWLQTCPSPTWIRVLGVRWMSCVGILRSPRALLDGGRAGHEAGEALEEPHRALGAQEGLERRLKELKL